jgi:hypothetical protein
LAQFLNTQSQAAYPSEQPILCIHKVFRPLLDDFRSAVKSKPTQEVVSLTCYVRAIRVI